MNCRFQLRVCWLSQWTLLFLAPMAVGSTIRPNITRPKPMTFNMPAELKHALQKQRMKESILHSLNISTPPFITARTLQIPKKKIPKRSPVQQFYTEQLRNVTLILSEATDPYRRDSMVFNIHSKVRSQLTTIDSPFIVLRLRLSSKRSSAASKKRKVSSTRRHVYANLCNNDNNNNNKNNNNNNNNNNNHTTIANSLMEKSEETSSRLLNMTKVCSRLSKKVRSRKASQSRAQQIRTKLRRLRPRKIRMVVRVLDPISNKKRRIFTQKVLLKKSKTITVPVPKNIFKAAAESTNHSLVVQVSCRNCKRHVKMDRVYRRGKKKRTNSFRLNPNRPYLYINNPVSRYNTNNDRVKERSRRYLSPKSCSSVARAHSKDTVYDSDLECCEESNYYTFEELGLGDIIFYPTGFSTVDCIGVCQDTKRLSSKQFTQGYFLGDFLRSSTSQESESQQRCVSTRKSHLDIFYFVNSNTIIPGRLVNFVGDSCGCSAV